TLDLLAAASRSAETINANRIVAAAVAALARGGTAVCGARGEGPAPRRGGGRGVANGIRGREEENFARQVGLATRVVASSRGEPDLRWARALRFRALTFISFPSAGARRALAALGGGR